MRIAFDLDDTLIPTTVEFSVGCSGIPFPLNIFYKEKLRNGSKRLLNNLSNSHEVWIYTSSLRTSFYLKNWFMLLGIKLSEVINYQRHQQKLIENPSFPKYSKVPKLFNIDLLIDDSLGVQMECDAQSVTSMIVDPADLDWDTKVLAMVNK